MNAYQKAAWYSMTTVLCGLTQGNTQPKELEGDENLFWFNCKRAHLFDHIPMEATWGDPEGKRVYDANIEVTEEMLTKKQVLALRNLRRIIENAEYQGRVHWRTCTTEKVSLEKMVPMKPNQDGSEFNPFHQDMYNMGQCMGENLMLMFGNHPNEECKYLVLVNTRTGERWKINVNFS